MIIFRQAKSEDILLGQTVYVEGDDGNLYRMKIDEVLRPGNPWKAFCADGCRYGLDGCFIKDET